MSHQIKKFSQTDKDYFNAYRNSHRLVLTWHDDEMLTITCDDPANLIDVLKMAYVFGTIRKVYPENRLFHAVIDPR